MYGRSACILAMPSDGMPRRPVVARQRTRRKLFFSDHARDQMELRDVTESDVQEALESADTSFPGNGPGNRVKIGTTLSGRRLKVVVKDRRQHIIVSTYWE